MVKVSMIMPIYNGEAYMRKSIDSILNQSFKEFELILVNDGSEDNTAEICNEYKAKDSRIRVIHKANEGSGPARNVGIKSAKGKYLMFPDCDDWLDKNMCEELYTSAELYDADLVIVGSKNIKEIDGEIIHIKDSLPGDKIYKSAKEIRSNYVNLLKKNVAQGPSDKLYKKDILDKYELEFPTLRRSQDIMFNMKYFSKIESCILINKPLYTYRMSSLTEMNKKIPENYFDISLSIYNSWKNILKEWGEDTEDNINYINDYLLASFKIHINNLFNNKYKYSFMQIVNFTEELLLNTELNEVLKNNKFKGINNLIKRLALRNKYTLIIMIIRFRMYLASIYHMIIQK